MATTEQIEHVFKKFIVQNPEEVLKGLNDVRAGMGAVIKVLNNSPSPVSAGTISKKTGVSTARTAVLLKKMLAKNLIIKQTDKNDARKTLITLSEFGKETAAKMKKELFEQISMIIDTVGMKKIELFVSLSEEVRSVAFDCLRPTIFIE